MTCQDCGRKCQRFGKHRNGLRRFRCPKCRKTFTEPHERTLGTMYIPQDKALLAVQLLLEGNSIRSTERITGLDRNTIMKVLVLAGEKCEKVMGRLIVNVPVTDVQCDEIWGYIRKKEGHKTPEEVATDATIGDAYTFVAIEKCQGRSKFGPLRRSKSRPVGEGVAVFVGRLERSLRSPFRAAQA